MIVCVLQLIGSMDNRTCLAAATAGTLGHLNVAISCANDAVGLEDGSDMRTVRSAT